MHKKGRGWRCMMQIDDKWSYHTLHGATLGRRVAEKRKQQTFDEATSYFVRTTEHLATTDVTGHTRVHIRSSLHCHGGEWMTFRAPCLFSDERDWLHFCCTRWEPNVNISAGWWQVTQAPVVVGVAFACGEVFAAVWVKMKKQNPGWIKISTWSGIFAPNCKLSP